MNKAKILCFLSLFMILSMFAAGSVLISNANDGDICSSYSELKPNRCVEYK